MDEQQLHKFFESLETEELLSKVQLGLTPDAHALALRELANRGISNNATEVVSTAKKDANAGPGFIKKCFTGKEKLWKAFWFPLIIALLIAWPLKVLVSAGPIGASLAYFMAVGLQVFWLISVWYCAFRSSHLVWGLISRVIVVIASLNTMLLLWSIVTR